MGDERQNIKVYVMQGGVGNRVAVGEWHGA